MSSIRFLKMNRGTPRYALLSLHEEKLRRLGSRKFGVDLGPARPINVTGPVYTADVIAALELAFLLGVDAARGDDPGSF